MSLETLATIAVISGIIKVSTRFYDLHFERAETTSKTQSGATNLVNIYFKLVVSTLPLWSSTIKNKKLRVLHNISLLAMVISSLWVLYELEQF
jgi:hypothetical protein